MQFASAEFIGLAIVFSLSYRFAPVAVKNSIVLPVTSVCFLFFASESGLSSCILCGFTVFTYLMTIMALRCQRTVAAAIAISLVLFVFAYLKRYEILSFLPRIRDVPIVVGLSYVLVRALHVHVDATEGSIKLPSFRQYFSYLIAWPALLSGPIMSFPSFVDETSRSAPPFDWRSVQRIVFGYFKLLVLAYFLEQVYWGALNGVVTDTGRQGATVEFFGNLAASLRTAHGVTAALATLWNGMGQASSFTLGAASVLYLVYLYFNFSGFIDIVCGFAGVMGLRMPENFNRPWRSRNTIEFWTRWHMTLANWFKTYVFNPVLRILIQFPGLAVHRDAVAVVAYFVTFFLLGVWHGPDLGFMLCGFMLGLGISINRIFQILARRILGKEAYARLAARSSYQALCMALTASSIAISVLPFWLSRGLLATTLFEFGIAGIGAAILFGSLVYLPIAVVALLEQRLNNFVSFPMAQKFDSIFTGILFGAVVIRILAFPLVTAKIVYQAF